MSFKGQRGESMEQSVNPAGGAVQDGPDFEQEGRWKLPNYYETMKSIPLKEWTNGELSDALYRAGVRLIDIANLTKISRFDVSNFVHRRFAKVSKKNRATLLKFFRETGFLPKPVAKHKHRCPICGATHIIKGSSHV